jgi:hypothetical protein
MITISEFKDSKCNSPEWWENHDFCEPVIGIDGESHRYTSRDIVKLLNIMDPNKSIIDWEKS